VYVNDLNIISHIKDTGETHNHLKTRFNMKDLGKTKFCLDLQLGHLPTGILIHQSTYVYKVPDTDPFRPREEGEEVLGPGFPYLSFIGVVIYLANNARPGIAFAVNLLPRHVQFLSYVIEME
jgi:hypothetical protein